jgi:uncharacterized phage protein gp47/JayE
MITIPTITQLRISIQSDLEAEWGDTLPIFGKVFLRVLSAVQAGKIWLIYKAIGVLQKNMAPDTADPESSGGMLERYGRLKLNRNPRPAVAGQYVVQVNGSVGAIIEAKTTFKSDPNSSSPGKLFILDEQVVLLVSPKNIILRALETGEDSKLNIDDGLVPTVVIANVNSGATVVDEAVEPLAAETIEEYRQDVVDAYSLEAQGGAGTDYRLWAADAQGVDQVYPVAKTGYPGQVNLFIEASIADSVDGKGTPSQTLIDATEEVINFDPDTSKDLNDRGRKPVQVIVNYLPVTPLDIYINVAGFVGIDSDIQDGITAALQELVSAIRPFVASADVLENKNDILDKNRIIASILTVYPGSTFGTITLQVSLATFESYQFLNGNIPYLADVTFN